MLAGILDWLICIMMCTTVLLSAARRRFDVFEVTALIKSVSLGVSFRNVAEISSRI